MADVTSSRQQQPREPVSKSGDIPRVGDFARQPSDKHHLLYCIYKIYDRAGSCIYVGQTSRLGARIVEHNIGRRRTNPKPWWAEVDTINIEHLAPGTTERETEVYERTQIEALQPKYNNEHNPAYRSIDKRRADQYTKGLRAEAKFRFSRHDGVTRLVTPEPRSGGPGVAASPTEHPIKKQADLGNQLSVAMLAAAVLLGMIIGLSLGFAL